jgi:hypothetical protein
MIRWKFILPSLSAVTILLSGFVGASIASPVFAAPFAPDDWSVFEKDAATSHAAEADLTPDEQAPRVRIPLTIRGFEKVLSSNSPGAREVMLGKRARQFNLRARLDRPNHFYFEDWHVETTPQKQLGRVVLKLSLSRTYGENRELEDHVGDMTVAGDLLRQASGLYVFKGQGAAKFTNRSGELTAEVRVNDERNPASGTDPGTAADPARVSALQPPHSVNQMDRGPVR